MNCILIVLPSGSDRNVSVRTVNPADGASCSLSIIANMASPAAAAALAASVCCSASIASQLAASPWGGMSGIAPMMALMRGSMRGSAATYETMDAAPYDEPHHCMGAAAPCYGARLNSIYARPMGRAFPRNMAGGAYQSRLMLK